jgi:hypothetical protein
LDDHGSGGFTLLDGGALVIGAAVASVHMREAVSRVQNALGWGLVWLTFAGVAISAAGPFEYLARRYIRRPAGYPRCGDWLWAGLGLPWFASALLRPGGLSPSGRGDLDLYRISLWVGVAAACVGALVVVWKNWVVAPPGRGLRDGPSPWTERVGLALAIGWPLQCGFALVVGE